MSEAFRQTSPDTDQHEQIATSAPKPEDSPKRKASETSQSTPAKKGLVIGECDTRLPMRHRCSYTDLSDDGFTSSRPSKTSTISPKAQASPSTSSKLKRAVPRVSRPQTPLFENAPDEDDEDNEVVLRPQRKRSRVDSPVATSVPAPPVPKLSSATATATGTPQITALKSSVSGVSQQLGTALSPAAPKPAPSAPPAPPKATPLKPFPALSSQRRQSIEVSGTTTQNSLASPASSVGDFEPVSIDWVDRNLDLCFMEAVKGSGHWICKLC